MSSALPIRPRQITSKKNITLVASLFNEEYTNALVENCLAELAELAPNIRPTVIRVPGAYEIPVVASTLAKTSNAPSLMIALGVIIQGDTEHGDLIATSCTQALQQIAISTQIPIINQVLLVEDEKQAYARCIATLLNRGREAARAAVTMLEVLQQINQKFSR